MQSAKCKMQNTKFKMQSANTKMQNLAKDKFDFCPLQSLHFAMERSDRQVLAVGQSHRQEF